MHVPTGSAQADRYLRQQDFASRRSASALQVRRHQAAKENQNMPVSSRRNPCEETSGIGDDEGTQHESAHLTVAGDLREMRRCGHPLPPCTRLHESARLTVAGDCEEGTDEGCTRLHESARLTVAGDCEKGTDVGTKHESARLTVAGSNQRTARSKAKRTKHLPRHTDPAKIQTTQLQQK